MWDDRFHFAGGSLDELRQAQPTTAQLRAFAQQALETHFVEPIANALSFLDPAREFLDALLTPFEDLITTLHARLAALLTGPASLTAIRDGLGRIDDLVKGLDLEFLRTSLHTLFDDIRHKLDDVSPQKLAEALDRSFAAVLDGITIDLILPPANVKQIDKTYSDVVEKLRLLDPSHIVNNVVKPLFEQKVVPLVDKFDVSPFIDTINDRLGSLDDELRAEIGHVNQAYIKLLAALPSGSTPSASVSVSVAA